MGVNPHRRTAMKRNLTLLLTASLTLWLMLGRPVAAQSQQPPLRIDPHYIGRRTYEINPYRHISVGYYRDGNRCWPTTYLSDTTVYPPDPDDPLGPTRYHWQDDTDLEVRHYSCSVTRPRRPYIPVQTANVCIDRREPLPNGLWREWRECRIQSEDPTDGEEA